MLGGLHLTSSRTPGYLPQVKAEASNVSPLNTPYGHGQDHGYMQDPSQFNLDHYAQRGVMNGSSTAAIGPERNKPRARQAATKRTGACARCRRLKVTLTSCAKYVQVLSAPLPCW